MEPYIFQALKFTIIYLKLFDPLNYKHLIMERMKSLLEIKRVVIILVIFLSGAEIQAQGDLSLGINTGYMKFMPWSHTGEFDQLTTTNQKEVMFGIHLNKQINSNYIVRAGVNFTHYSPWNEFWHESFGVSKQKGSNNPLIQIAPSIHRQIFIVSRFGLQVGLGLILQHNFSKDYSFVDDKSFQAAKIQELDENGSPILRPAIDLTLTGSETKGPVIALYLRPEAGFFYDLKNAGRISLDVLYGLPLNGPTMTKNYDVILFEGETSSAKHELKGNYLAFMVGYAFRLK
jgi:hypothetical protein